MKSSLPRFLILTLLCLPSLCLAQEEVETREIDKEWVTVTVPVSAHFGEEVTAQIVVKADAVKEDSTLQADLHTFTGEERHPGKGHSKPFPVSAGQELKESISFTVPADEVTHISFVIYLLPKGETLFVKKTYVTEANVPVRP